MKMQGSANEDAEVLHCNQQTDVYGGECLSLLWVLQKEGFVRRVRRGRSAGWLWRERGREREKREREREEMRCVILYLDW
jgi:hypothetical protein